MMWGWKNDSVLRYQKLQLSNFHVAQLTPSKPNNNDPHSPLDSENFQKWIYLQNDIIKRPIKIVHKNDSRNNMEMTYVKKDNTRSSTYAEANMPPTAANAPTPDPVVDVVGLFDILFIILLFVEHLFFHLR